MQGPQTYGGLFSESWTPPAMVNAPYADREPAEDEDIPEKSIHITAVSDAQGLDDIVSKFNHLLASLRAAGLLEAEQEEGENQ
ncbi:MAG: hypothetical protein Q3Y08_01840 [Butyricicoccus sp.]|nr:hypothetical protein [Butyricicoccus sp.]